MTFTQILLISIALLTAGFAAHMIKQVVKSCSHPLMDIEPDYCHAGSFRDPIELGTDMQPGEAFALKPVFLVLLLGIAGAVFTAVWREANPDIRTPYGRAYERCVAKEQISRWQVEVVRHCVNSMRAG